MKFILLVLILLAAVGCTSDVSKNPSKDQITISKLSPQTALAKVKILNKKNNSCKISVIKTLEYGANTPILRPETKLKLRFNSDVKIKVGEIYYFILSSESAEDDKTFWSFLSIKKEEK